MDPITVRTHPDLPDNTEPEHDQHVAHSRTNEEKRTQSTIARKAGASQSSFCVAVLSPFMFIFPNFG